MAAVGEGTSKVCIIIIIIIIILAGRQCLHGCVQVMHNALAKVAEEVKALFTWTGNFIDDALQACHTDVQ